MLNQLSYFSTSTNEYPSLHKHFLQPSKLGCSYTSLQSYSVNSREMKRLLPFAAFVFSFSSSSFSELSELLTGSGTLIFSGMAASSSLTFLLEFGGVLREDNGCQNGEKIS